MSLVRPKCQRHPAISADSVCLQEGCEVGIMCVACFPTHNIAHIPKVKTFLDIYEDKAFFDPYTEEKASHIKRISAIQEQLKKDHESAVEVVKAAYNHIKDALDKKLEIILKDLQSTFSLEIKDLQNGIEGKSALLDLLNTVMMYKLDQDTLAKNISEVLSIMRNRPIHEKIIEDFRISTNKNDISVSLIENFKNSLLIEIDQFGLQQIQNKALDPFSNSSPSDFVQTSDALVETVNSLVNSKKDLKPDEELVKMMEKSREGMSVGERLGHAVNLANLSMNWLIHAKTNS